MSINSKRHDVIERAIQNVVEEEINKLVRDADEDSKLSSGSLAHRIAQALVASAKTRGLVCTLPPLPFKVGVIGFIRTSENKKAFSYDGYSQLVVGKETPDGMEVRVPPMGVLDQRSTEAVLLADGDTLNMQFTYRSDSVAGRITISKKEEDPLKAS